MDSLLIYGSYGYTGRLIAREAVSRGGTPVIAGRNEEAVTRQADELGVDGRVFSLSDDVAGHLREFDAVLNCAGPFVTTAEPLVEACLETGTDYLDITGEFQVFERLRRRDDSARDTDVTLLPGIGFEVVPSDCLAAFLHDQLPSATSLTIGVKGTGPLSRGTARTFVEQLGTNGVVRRNGRLLEVPLAFQTRDIDFGSGLEHAVTVPWADVVTAAYSTGIDSIEVYAAVPSWATYGLSAVDSLDWLLERDPVKQGLERLVETTVDGPSERELATDTATVWGEVLDERTGKRATARVHTPNPYALTAEVAVTGATRILDGHDTRDQERVPAGFQTPASAFGSDFVLECAGTERELCTVPSDSAEPERTLLESDD